MEAEYDENLTPEEQIAAREQRDREHAELTGIRVLRAFNIAPDDPRFEEAMGTVGNAAYVDLGEVKNCYMAILPDYDDGPPRQSSIGFVLWADDIWQARSMLARHLVYAGVDNYLWDITFVRPVFLWDVLEQTKTDPDPRKTLREFGDYLSRLESDPKTKAPWDWRDSDPTMRNP